MIEASGLTKRFGRVLAVDGLTFSIRPGEVTGFLGRNGAGKTTTLRMALGLERPTAGTVTVDGRPYAELASPLRHVGALLDARAVNPGRSAAQHLSALASSNGIDGRRVSEMLELVGLGSVGSRPAGTLSLGMLQRLGLAAALLGDPPTLVLDEPLNGLDPEGIIWFRGLMRQMAEEGRAILMSSHLMSEVAVTADHLLIIGEGRLLVDSGIAEFQRENEHEEVRVRTPDPQALRRVVVEAGGAPRDLDANSFAVSGLDCATIGALALNAGVELHELAAVRRPLEDAFMELTAPGTGPEAHPGDASATAPRPPADPAGVDPAAPTWSPTTEDQVPAARFLDVVRSELVKFRTSRSQLAAAAGSLTAGVGLAALAGNARGERWTEMSARERRSFDPTELSLKGRFLVQISIGIMGGLAVTSEYGTDTITPSLTAVPDRTRLLMAKTITTAGVSLAIGLATATGSFVAGQALLSRHGARHDRFGSPGSTRAVLGGGLYFSSAALLGLGIGTLTRDTAGTITTIFGTELIVVAIKDAFPNPLPDLMGKYWPTEAGARVLTTRPDPSLLGPWTGLGVMAGSTAAVLAAAFVAFRRRDV